MNVTKENSFPVANKWQLVKANEIYITQTKITPHKFCVFIGTNQGHMNISNKKKYHLAYITKYKLENATPSIMLHEGTSLNSIWYTADLE